MYNTLKGAIFHYAESNNQPRGHLILISYYINYSNDL